MPSPTAGDDGSIKRNLPSWMSSRDNGNKQTIDSENDKVKFSKLLDGVVIVLSGYVNPERGTLRSQALEMGAEYRPDWTTDCTLLVCNYSNTPKFRQVQADSGTIVNKEWITECYSQKKLVEIDTYLMHAGRPWRKASSFNQSEKEKESLHTKPDNKVEKRSPLKPNAASSSKSRASESSKELFSLSKVKVWAIDDLSRTISWLGSQEEKPDPSDIKQIAAEGIVICLQDAIDLLEQNQDVRKVAEQWNVLPQAVEELIKLAHAESGSASFSTKELCRQAKACKQMYEAELSVLHDDSPKKTKGKKKTDEIAERHQGKSKAISDEYDSDETIEMTEEEIDHAYNIVRATTCK